MKFHLRFPNHIETRYIHLDTSQCKACWACVTACPRHILGKVDLRFHKHARVDQAEKCKGCLKCVKACINGAIHARETIHDNASR